MKKILPFVFASTVAITIIINTDTQAFAQNTVATPVKTTSFYTGNIFIDTIAPASARIAAVNGLYASVMIAQAALESRYGASGLAQQPNNNLFGMKGAFNGQSVYLNTKEQTKDGEVYSTKAAFKKYPSKADSLRDYVKLILNGPGGNTAFYRGALKNQTTSYKDATAFLQGKYATDTAYAAKLNAVIELYDLTRFDVSVDELKLSKEENAVEKVEHTEVPSKNVETNKQKRVKKSVLQTEKKQTKSTVTYKVAKGDTLSEVAKTFGTTQKKLIIWNNLKTTALQQGQKLIVKKKSHQIKSTVKIKTYVVKDGDSLSSIARQYSVTEKDLMKQNSLTSNFVYKGQTLYIK